MAPLPPFAFGSAPLLLISIWHASSSLRSYFTSPSLFHARSWHPLPRIRHAELFLELLLLTAASLYQSIALSNLPFPSTSHALALQQLAVLLLFLLVLFLVLLSEATSALPLPQDANFLLLAVAFGVESFVVYRSTPDPELSFERESFHILAAMAAVSAILCILLSWRPNSVLASLSFSASIFLQATWLLQLGVSLYSERFLPEGCHHLSNGFTQCDVDAAKLHAVALMDLAIIAHIGITFFAFSVLYALAWRAWGSHRRSSGLYEAVDAVGESDHSQMKPVLAKVVID